MKLINIDTSQKGYSSAELVLATDLSPRTILDALIEAGHNPPISTRDAIAATVAQLLIKEGEESKYQLVLPTTLLIERTIQPKTVETTPPNSLVGLKKAIIEENNSLKKGNLGIILGDKSLTMHAGMIGSRKMGDNNQTRSYAFGMGIDGYQTAIEHFYKRIGQTNSAEPIRVTANNFLEISEILRGLTIRKSFKDGLILLAKYQN